MEPVEDPAGTGAYPPSWEADVVLSDGHTVRVRPILPADADALERFHHRQSPESIYFRYFSPRPRLSAKDLAHLTVVDHHDRVAFVAWSSDEMIAVARYERYRGTDTAEVAFFVDDAHHGRGLASLMLEYLVAAALDNGIRRFVATTLPNNRKMLSVFSSAGYQVASRLEDGVIEISFEIGPTGEAIAAIDRRERAAEAASVRPLLAPTSVAVVGVGRSGGLGAEVFTNLRAQGFTGPVHAVNPHADRIGEQRVFGSVAELPEPVDLAVVALPASQVPEAVEQCGRRGVRAVLVLSAGFSEAGDEGVELERATLAAARRHGMRMLGPNALGVVNTDPEVRLDATPAPVLPRAGRVAVMAEAGTLSAAIVDHAARMELGLSTMVAAGNRVDVNASDLLSYWTEDDRTGAVLLYLAARHLRPRFVRAARAASLRKPVVALHSSLGAGDRERSVEARRRALAMFRQTGVISVDTLEQLFDVGRVVADQPVPEGHGVVVVGNSDGAVALAADACAHAGLELVDLDVDADGARSPRAVGSPVDLRFTADAAAFAEVLARAGSDPRVHAVIVVSTPPGLAWDPEIGDAVLAASAAAPQVTFAATMLGAAGRSRLVRTEKDGSETAVPIFRFPEDAARAIGRLAGYTDWRRRAATVPTDGLEIGDAEAVRHLLETVSTPGRSDESTVGPDPVLDHHLTEAILDAYDVRLIERRVVTSVEEAVVAAEEIGWPVALKSAVRDRSTRSVASGVVLDIADAQQLRVDWARLEEAVGPAMLPMVVQRFLDSGVDVAVRVVRDVHGSGTVSVGLGGPAAILDEHEMGVLPLSLADASTLVAASPVGRVLTDPLDRVPVVDLVHRLAALVDSHESVHRIHADPVVSTPMWAGVADVEIVVGDPVEDFAVRRLD